MNPSLQKLDQTPSKRRYLVHLFLAYDEISATCRYTARIRIWTSRSIPAQTCERVFRDECELIETVNPLLPNGSDVRYVFSHIESLDGFFYLLHLNLEQAKQLGWRG
jgi:hypothetical protein